MSLRWPSGACVGLHEPTLAFVGCCEPALAIVGLCEFVLVFVGCCGRPAFVCLMVGDGKTHPRLVFASEEGGLACLGLRNVEAAVSRSLAAVGSRRSLA
jgi:hypothetical protein